MIDPAEVEDRAQRAASAVNCPVIEAAGGGACFGCRYCEPERDRAAAAVRAAAAEYGRLLADGVVHGCVGRPYGCWCSFRPQPGTDRCARCTGLDYPELRNPPEDRRAGGASALAILEAMPGAGGGAR